jgi:hypothetical protein
MAGRIVLPEKWVVFATWCPLHVSEVRLNIAANAGQGEQSMNNGQKFQPARFEKRSTWNSLP